MRQSTFTKSRLMAVILAVGPWQAAQAASPFAREVPSTYAKFEKGADNLTLVVAELVATAYLKGYDCPKTTTSADGITNVVICLNPPPTWFKARVLQHVAGQEIGDEFYAVTGSHYGAMKVGADQPATLMLLNSNGTALEMLRYSSWPVAKNPDGQYHLTVENGPIHSYPCWAGALMQELGYPEFAADLAVPRPHYAIPVASLQQGLKDLPLTASHFSCRKPIPSP